LIWLGDGQLLEMSIVLGRSISADNFLVDSEDLSANASPLLAYLLSNFFYKI